MSDLKEGLRKATMRRKGRTICLSAEQSFPMKLVKRGWKFVQVHKSEEEKTNKQKENTELGPGLAWSSMRQIQWPFHSNTLYILEAERFILEQFGFNYISIAPKKNKRPPQNISTHWKKKKKRSLLAGDQFIIPPSPWTTRTSWNFKCQSSSEFLYQ